MLPRLMSPVSMGPAFLFTITSSTSMSALSTCLLPHEARQSKRLLYISPVSLVDIVVKLDDIFWRLYFSLNASKPVKLTSSLNKIKLNFRLNKLDSLLNLNIWIQMILEIYILIFRNLKNFLIIVLIRISHFFKLWNYEILKKKHCPIINNILESDLIENNI